MPLHSNCVWRPHNRSWNPHIASVSYFVLSANYCMNNSLILVFRHCSECGTTYFHVGKLPIEMLAWENLYLTVFRMALEMH